MNVLLERIARRDTYTIGRLYIDGIYICDVLEDKDRGLKDTMTLEEIQRIKVYGKTAIPTGRYKIRMDLPSPKYQRKARSDSFWRPYCDHMPRIEGTKGFTGCLFHAGTTEEDTLGCVLVGENSIVGKLTNSRTTFKKLFQILWDGTKHGREMIYFEVK